MTHSEEVVESEGVEVTLTSDVNQTEKVLQSLNHNERRMLETTRSRKSLSYLRFFPILHCQDKVKVSLVILINIVIANYPN